MGRHCKRTEQCTLKKNYESEEDDEGGAERVCTTLVVEARINKGLLCVKYR